MLEYYLTLFFISLLLTIIFKMLWTQHTNMNVTLVFIFIPISMLGYVFYALSTNVEEALLANKMIYLGGCFLQMFVTLAIMTLFQIRFPKGLSLAMMSLSIGLYGLVCTAGFLPIFYKKVSYEKKHGVVKLIKEYAPLHNLFYVLLIGYSLLGISILIYCLIKKRNFSTRTTVLLLFAEILGPLCYFLTKLLHADIELVPISYVTFQIVFLLVMDHAELYVISLTQSQALVENDDNGFLALDKKRRFLGANETALAAFPQLRSQKIDALIRLKKEPLKKLPVWLDELDQAETDSLIKPYEWRSQYYKFIIGYLRRGKRIRGYQIIMIDETKERKYTNLLKKFNNELTEEVKKQTEHIQEIQDKMILGLADMVENRDTSTGGHIKRTSDVVRILMEEMLKDPACPVNEEFARMMIKAAPMHDLGKIAVDDAILRKPGRFTPEEFEVMKTHAAKGAEIVRKVVKDIEDPKFARLAENVAHYHHERIDGSGYPDHLKGDDIPYEARIMAIADVYDALVSKRCYKDKMSFSQAFDIIEEGMGTQFDADLNKYFVACRKKLENYYQALPE